MPAIVSRVYLKEVESSDSVSEISCVEKTSFNLRRGAAIICMCLLFLMASHSMDKGLLIVFFFNVKKIKHVQNQKLHTTFPVFLGLLSELFPLKRSAFGSSFCRVQNISTVPFFVCWPVYFFDLVVCCGAGFFQSFLPHECLLTSRLPPWFSSLLPWLQRYVAPVLPSYLHSHCQASPSILAPFCKSSSAVCQFVVWSTDSSIHFFVRYCGGFSLWTFLCLDPVLERFYPHLKKKKKKHSGCAVQLLMKVEKKIVLKIKLATGTSLSCIKSVRESKLSFTPAVLLSLWPHKPFADIY